MNHTDNCLGDARTPCRLVNVRRNNLSGTTSIICICDLIILDRKCFVQQHVVL